MGENDFEIVSKDAEIDECYGLETFYITKEEIAALLSGKNYILLLIVTSMQ